jgi:GTP-binding protein
MFVDRVKIRVRGGRGGNGSPSLRREKFIPRGGPDGGDGGPGGNVILVTDENQQSLTPLRYMNHYEGEDGAPGLSKDQHGRSGKDVIVRVPPGTIIRDLDLEVEDESERVLADLDSVETRFMLANGGVGGKGNRHFVTPVNRAPREFGEGAEGEERYLELELKLVADVGLVGYPNAGKSTLLGALTNAKPETAAYPFTTLTPNIGTVLLDDFSAIRIADIPGLIDGAHENVGLGHAFLRHIERTKVLAYVLDMAATDGTDPWDAFAALQQELEWHHKGLSKRPAIVVANKMDEAVSAENLDELRQRVYLPIFPVCALLEEDTPALIPALCELLGR